MKKHGTHWKPEQRTEIAEAKIALRPVITSRALLALLQDKRAKLEAELRDLFAARREGKGGLPISRRSRQLREVKQEIKRVAPLVQP